ncbi:MAG: hypothetical protein WAR59_04040 [Ignavibacteriaceae bacterium]
MKTTVIIVVLFLTYNLYCQEQMQDKIVLTNGKTIVGKIEKIETDFVEFKERKSGLILEKLKVEIRYIQLSSGNFLTFDERGNEIVSEQLPALPGLSYRSKSTLISLLGLSIGYGTLSMREVNDDLMESQNIFYAAGFKPKGPDNIDGGLFFEGNFKFGLGNFNFGVCGNYINSKGEFRYSDGGGLFYENYDVSTLEVLGILEILLPINETKLNFFMQIGGGVGMAKVGYDAEFRVYNNPANNFKVRMEVDGKYFSGRIKSGIKLNLKRIILEAGVGYRISNAGELKGTYYEGDQKYEDLPITDINREPISFDFSGFLFAAGISLRL